MIDNNDTLNKAPNENNGQIVKRVHTWEMAESERGTAGPAMLYELEMMSELPDSAEQREFYADELWVYIVSVFGARLSPADQNSLNAILDGTARNDRLLQELDVFLAGEQCGKWGYLLWTSKYFLRRYAHWEAHDMRLLKLCHKTLERRAKHRQGLTGGWLPVRREDVEQATRAYMPDVRLLFQRFRDEYGHRRLKPNNADLLKFARIQMEKNSADYRALPKDPRLFDCLQGQGDKFASQVVSKKVTPTQFLHRWIERGTGYRWSHLKDLKK